MYNLTGNQVAKPLQPAGNALLVKYIGATCGSPPFKQRTSVTWCSDAPLRDLSQLSVMRIFSHAQALIRLCTVSTVLFAAPVLVKEVLRPTSRGLLICMASSAFAFYLFSYQVRFWHGQPASAETACHSVE